MDTSLELRERLVDPAERGAWLKSARSTRLWLAGVLLLGMLVVPVLSSTLADSVYEPKRARRLFSRAVKRDPAAESLEGWLELGFWICGLGLVARKAWRERPARLAESGAADGGGGAASPWMDQATLMAPGEAVNDTGVRSHTASPTAALPPGEGGVAQAPVPNAPGAGGAGLGVRYRIESELGRGGMGVVYRATDTILDRTVALKSLPAELLSHRELVARFQREAKVVAALTHPHIVAVYDLVHQDGQLYMAMELVVGQDLAGLMSKQGALPEAQALAIAVQCARALAHAHAQGIVHRDFKPDNVLLTADGTAKVSDFGIAKAQDKPQMTQTGAVMGTPYYMSPEQATGGDVDSRTDLYALGATLYELLSGAPPFTGNTAQLLMKHLNEEPPPLADRAPHLDRRVCELVHALLQKDRERRPTSMAAVADTLEGLRVALSA